MEVITIKKFMDDTEIARIKFYIRKHGESVGSLANMLGWSRSKLSAKINGKAEIGRTEMEEIGKALNEDPIKIFFGHGLR